MNLFRKFWRWLVDGPGYSNRPEITPRVGDRAMLLETREHLTVTEETLRTVRPSQLYFLSRPGPSVDALYTDVSK